MSRSAPVFAVVATLALGACGANDTATTHTAHTRPAHASGVSVRITAPQRGASVKPSVTVRGVVSPQRATVDVNGEPAKVRAGRFSAVVVLKRGDGRLRAIAAAHGVTDQSSVTVRRLPAAAEKRAAARKRTAEAQQQHASNKTTGGSDGSFVMPNEVGMDLQDAQDDIQRVSGDPLFVSHSRDATGDDRFQILDRDWKVCSQNVPPGEGVSPVGHIVFSVVKDDEDCP